jgi:prevent-host-death family protein
MQISVKDAQEKLAELLDRVESGEDVILTRDGKSIARIVRAAPALTREEREAAFDRTRAMAPPLTEDQHQPSLDDIQARVRRKIDPFPETSAARSQDFLYDEDGIPR